jgi:hypothetical protein
VNAFQDLRPYYYSFLLHSILHIFVCIM